MSKSTPSTTPKPLRIHAGRFQVITTRYLGPTNTRGSRIKASADGGSVTIGHDSALSSENAHAKAARALCVKLGWTGTLISGVTASGEHVFVFVDVAELTSTEGAR